MHLNFGISNKTGIEGVVLAVDLRSMRIAAHGQIDALDLQCDEDGKWTTEYGDCIVWHSPLGIEEGDSARLIKDLYPRVLVARS